MKKNSLIIGASALALCVCAAAVLVKVAITPANDPDPSSGQTFRQISTESSSAASVTPPASSTTSQGASVSTSSPVTTGSEVSASGSLLPAPAPVDLSLESITLLVNRDYTLTEDYVPEDLIVPDVRFTFSYYSDKKLMRQEAADALEELFAAGDAEGIHLYGVSAYRSYSRQYTIYATNLITRGIKHTNRYSAAPGASEHQTGLAIDVSSESAGYSLEEVFGTTKEGIWLAKNAHRFGFIIRYPKEKEEITGYAYEPWHIRYVGTELAAYLYESGLTLDEYYGYEPAVMFASLAETPLIDTESERYQSLYASLVKPSQAPTEEPDPGMNDEEYADAMLGTEPVTDSSSAEEAPDITDGTDEVPDSGMEDPSDGYITEGESPDSEEPTESEEPSNSGDPSGSEESSDPEGPADSEESSDSEAPSDPEAPSDQAPSTGEDPISDPEPPSEETPVPTAGSPSEEEDEYDFPDNASEGGIPEEETIDWEEDGSEDVPA